MERPKSIVNGQHMRAVKHQMDTEYQAYLRHQERERERVERARELQAASQNRSHPNTSVSSARRYSKPWQTGMTTKIQIPGGSGNDKVGMGCQYTSTVSKLPSIKKEPIKKAVPRTSTARHTKELMTVSQPRITVEKKIAHARQPSSKPAVTHRRDVTGKEGNVIKSQDKAKETRRWNHLKQKSKVQGKTNQSRKNSLSIQNPCSEQNLKSHNGLRDQALCSPQDLRDGPDTVSEPASSRRSPSQTYDHGLNGIPEINSEDNMDHTNEANVIDHLWVEESFSDNESRIPLPLTPLSYDTRRVTEPNFLRSSLPELDAISIESDMEELADEDIINYNYSVESLGSARNGLNTVPTSSMRRLSTLPVLSPPQSLQELTVSQVEEDSHSNPSASLYNSRNFTELRRISVASPAQEHYRTPTMSETTLPLIHDVNGNTRNQQYHIRNQGMTRTPEDRNRTILGGENSSNLHDASLGLSLFPTPPGVTISHDNFDMIFHTISMQRQSDRRNLESIFNTASERDNEKPKPDPEKLKRLQESLLEEDSEEEGDLCRICLTGEHTEENNLIAPCRCTGSLKYVHIDCMKRWLLSKIKSGAEMSAVKSCEMCKQKVECDFEGFSLSEHYRRHQETQATLNPSLYLVLLLHLYQQRYEELLRLSNTRERVNEISRRFSHLQFGRHDQDSRVQ
ncbi:probable E3 ubiquitin-protein ligase MARCHF10 isoform X2 [Hyperolius riggenbachi]|uniref:probable E3 ubiquitin-protein ligase MARCHF10 isoform X2 n=1 Tax=Hyperolius riggenbachi TaxID=752182 RepID=UPI0035A36B11